MVDARNLFKYGLIVLLMASSCSRESQPIMESHGLEVDDTSFFVDAVSLDSVSFASGLHFWVLNGLIVSNGLEYPFRTVYDKNPFNYLADPVKVFAPGLLLSEEGDIVECVLTKDGNMLTLSWEYNGRFLLVRTSLISAH